MITFAKATPDTVHNQILSQTGITKIGGSRKYLGLLEHIVRKRKEVFDYTADNSNQDG